MIFLQRYALRADGTKIKHYYTDESVGIATGMLITALYRAWLATLTHTPSPMGFLNEIPDRPKDTERPYLILVVGHRRRNVFGESAPKGTSGRDGLPKNSQFP